MTRQETNSAMKRATRAIVVLALVVPALYHLYLLGAAIWGRYDYPYDLEWMEGGLLHHAQRYLEGHDIYQPPSITFIPYLYTPLYPLILAGVGKIAGLSYQTGRAISLVATAGIGVIILIIARAAALPRSAERRWSWACGMVACGYFAATYPYLEGWYDLVRGDSLFVFLALSGALLVSTLIRPATSAPYSDPFARSDLLKTVLAATFLAASFFAKQNGALVIIWVGVALLAIRWRLAFAYGASVGLLAGGGTLLYNWLSGGWYWIYIFEYFQQHSKSSGRFSNAIGLMLWERYPLWLGIIGAGLVATITDGIVHRRLSYTAKYYFFWLWMLSCGLVIGALSWSHQWAHYNGFMPALVFFAICGGVAVIALFDALRNLSRLPKTAPWHASLTHKIPSIAVVISFIVAGYELVGHRWNADGFVPKTSDRSAGDRLIKRLRSVKGEIYVPFHTWYAHLAGKVPYAHRMGLMDVTYLPPKNQRNPRLSPRATHVEGLAEMISEQRFAAIVLDNRATTSRYPELTRYYRQANKLGREMSPRVYSGAKTAPAAIWLPRRPP